uniref:Amino acid transporter transmembrane domain-containing protein n=1 Tax=Corethron hystrix TaxID=216773 RepID=A0A7S1B7N2_9STRA
MARSGETAPLLETSLSSLKKEDPFASEDSEPCVCCSALAHDDDDDLDEFRIPLDDGTVPGMNPALYFDVEKSNLKSVEDPGRPWDFGRFLRILGPGIMVCLADTDGPCLLTAAQSGAQYQYSLVLCQLGLIPVLYGAQELTVRLAVCTKQGLTALIKERYGPVWSWTACVLHVAMCWLGQASEFGAIGQLFRDAFGVDRRITNTIQFLFLCGIILMGRLGYRLTEIVGLTVGSLQLIFVGALCMTHANVDKVVKGIGEFYFKESNYEVLLAGNIGAVIMPWMLYYQQSAVCERKIKRKDLKYERMDTLIGALLAQCVMMSMVIGMGALRYYGNDLTRNSLGFGDIIGAYAQAFSGNTWDKIQPGATTILDVQPAPEFSLSYAAQQELLVSYAAQIETWYTPTNYILAKWVVVLGVCGACTVASIVLTITPVWSTCELLGIERDLFLPFKERPLQYCLQIGGLAAAYITSISTDISGPWFAILTQTINGLLILPVAAFLWLLSSSPEILPEDYRLKGWYKWLLAFVFSIVCVYCVYGMIQEIIHPM